MKKFPLIPEIPEEEKTPAVCLLLAFIEQQQEIIQNQQIEIDALKAEIAKLKKLPPKPKIRASKLPKDDDNDNPTGHSGNKKNKTGNGTGNSRKRKKKLNIHKTTIIKPDNLPEQSRFLGYQDYFVQDLKIEPFNTRYRLARYQKPDGDTCIGQLTFDTHTGHFGHTLQSYIIYQYYHQRVTQPLIKQQLTELGIDISAGQINEILIHDKDNFHTEKHELLTAGINNSTYIHVDDTGSRHDGKNGYCTHIGNETFAWFASTRFKSRINFLQLLRGKALDYTINETALDYMRTERLPHQALSLIEQCNHTRFDNEERWNNYLKENSITTKRHVRIATEGVLLGTLIDSGFPIDLVIMSDDAGQFDILLHALCWIHADRVFQRILPLNKRHDKELNWVHTQIWEIFYQLKQYKLEPNEPLKLAIAEHFDELCRTKTSFETLNQALKRLAKNKKELLLVLERPDIPLHNNLSENDIREYVIKRKISGSTRSKKGQLCRDTFVSLKKTCLKQGISFWDFINDRISNKNLIPYLYELLEGKACII